MLFRSNPYFVYPDTVAKPLKAAALSLFPDALIYSINRATKKDFAFINGQTITSNFMFTALWDNDMFGTNLLSHPFHGSLDYGGARVSGMNYWQAIPYTFTASLIWELVLENEPMSYNDQIATSFGGPILGEASYRISSSIIKNEAKGFERVAREIFGALTCPMNGIDRLLTGQMWRVKRSSKNLEYFSDNLKNYYKSSFNKNLYHNQYCAPKTRINNDLSSSEIGYKYINIQANVELSYRHVWEEYPNKEKISSPYITINYIYGNPFDTYKLRPFDYFRFKFGLNLKKNDNLLNFLDVTGLLWGKEIEEDYVGTNAMWGIFQHFRYKDTEGNMSDYVPSWRYSEPASVGIGLITDSRIPWHNFSFEGYFNLVFLAAAPATNFNLKGRQYNYGQGYSLNMYLDYNFKNRVNIGLENYMMQFFTWIGYDSSLKIDEQDFRKLRAMGDKGNTVLFNIRPYINLYLFNNFSLNFNYSLFIQYTFNKNYKNLRPE